jgi:hypothetical protein
MTPPQVLSLILQTAPSIANQPPSAESLKTYGPIAIGAASVLIAFFVFLLNLANRIYPPVPRLPPLPPTKFNEEMIDLKIDHALRAFGESLNHSLMERSRRSIRFQLGIACLLLALIGGGGYYLWEVTASIQSSVQQEKLQSLIRADVGRQIQGLNADTTRKTNKAISTRNKTTTSKVQTRTTVENPLPVPADKETRNPPFTR